MPQVTKQVLAVDVKKISARSVANFCRGTVASGQSSFLKKFPIIVRLRLLSGRKRPRACSTSRRIVEKIARVTSGAFSFGLILTAFCSTCDQKTFFARSPRKQRGPSVVQPQVVLMKIRVMLPARGEVANFFRSTQRHQKWAVASNEGRTIRMVRQAVIFIPKITRRLQIFFSS